MSAFAREHDLNIQRIRYWHDRVGPAGEAKHDGAVRPRTKKSSKFVPGVVIDARGTVSVHLCRGVVVEAESTEALEPTWLAKLERALEEAP